MKITSKITAIIMALVLLCTTVTPVFASTDSEPQTRAEYAEMVEKATGTKAITTVEFFATFNKVGDFFRLMTNDRFPSEEKLDITFDKFLTDANMYIVKNSGLDVQMIFKNFPTLNNVSALLVDTFEIDTVELRKQLYAESDRLNAEGNGSLALILHLFGAYMSIIEKIEVYAEPTDDPVLYQVAVNVLYKDGFKERFGTDIYINTETGDCVGAGGKGMLNIGFDFNFSDMVVYAVADCWFRHLGFAVIYDEIANLLPIYRYITRRYYFDYNGLEWLIQAWKGNYVFVVNGAEVGIYNRVPGEELGTFYNCSEKEYTMTLKVSCGDELLVNLAPTQHWWINGFKLNGKVYEATDLDVEYTIEMPDMEMVRAFAEAIENEEHHDTEYSINGTTITVRW